MNFLEKIKKFFSKKEVPQIPEKSLNEQMRREFIARNKVEPKELLNPKVCKGEKFIENILNVCGVDPDLAKSPIVKAEVEDTFFSIIEADKKLLTDIYLGNEINADTIKKCVKKLKKAQKDTEKISDKLLIDEDGKITIVGDLRTKEERKNSKVKKIGTKKISINEATLGIVVTEKYHQHYEKSEHELLRNEEHEAITHYNRFNIMMKKKDRKLEEFYEGLDLYHVSESIRNPHFPFIIHQSIETKSYEDDTVRKKDERIITYTNPSIELLDLYLLESSSDKGNPEEGIKVIDENEDLKEYYNSNKSVMQKFLLTLKTMNNKVFNGTTFLDLYKYILYEAPDIRKDLEEKDK